MELGRYIAYRGESLLEFDEPTGVFACAYCLKRTQSLNADQTAILKGILRYLGANLPHPERLHKSKAIFWFKLQNQDLDVWNALLNLVEFLRLHKVRVEWITTDRPGYVVYEDEWQVAAMPFNDTFERTL
jgi:hypothetical protein